MCIHVDSGVLHRKGEKNTRAQRARTYTEKEKVLPHYVTEKIKYD